MNDDHAKRNSERPSNRPSSDDLREYLPARDPRDMKTAGAEDARPVTKPARPKPARGPAKGLPPVVVAGAVLAVVGPLLFVTVVMERKTDEKIAAALAKARADTTAPSTGAARAPAPTATTGPNAAPAPSAAPATSAVAAPDRGAGSLVEPRAVQPRQASHLARDPYDDAAPPAPAPAQAEPRPTSDPQAPAPQPSATSSGDLYFHKRD
jgi:hypothetical protein